MLTWIRPASKALADALAATVQPGDMVVCLGAGDITKWAAGLAGAIEVAAVHTNANASLIAGYTLIQVRSRDEALEWARRHPAPMGEFEDGEIELRPLVEPERPVAHP